MGLLDRTPQHLYLKTWVANDSLAVWRSTARLAWEVAIWHQSGHVLVWQLGAGPFLQDEHSGIKNKVNSSLAK